MTSKNKLEEIYPISKKEVTFVNSLKEKKNRQFYKQFCVEGEKLVQLLFDRKIKIEWLFATEDWIRENDHFEDINHLRLVNEEQLKKISSLVTPNEVLAVVNQDIRDEIAIVTENTIVLDNIKDPGNLGTIIRLADWFGIPNIVCSKSTVDCYNSKVVQATMGALFNIKIDYLDLDMFFQNQILPIYGADVEGTNIYENKLPSKMILVMGSESHGISENVHSKIEHFITIPKFQDNPAVESLNVSIATSIICALQKTNV